MISGTIVAPSSNLQLSPGSCVTIDNVRWDDYEFLLLEMGDRSCDRMIYSCGTLEIMSPLPEQEIPCDLTSDVMKLLLRRGFRHFVTEDDRSGILRVSILLNKINLPSRS